MFGTATASFADTITLFDGNSNGAYLLHWNIQGCLMDCTYGATLPTSGTFGQPLDISAFINIQDAKHRWPNNLIVLSGL